MELETFIKCSLLTYTATGVFVWERAWRVCEDESWRVRNLIVDSLEPERWERREMRRRERERGRNAIFDIFDLLFCCLG